MITPPESALAKADVPPRSQFTRKYKVTPMRSCLRTAFAIVAAALLIALPGCTRTDEVTKYTVKKIKQPERKVQAPVMPDLPPADVGPSDRDRMLAAIVPHGKVGWFFKMTGSREAVGKTIEQFASLIQSIKFSDGDDAKPDWTLPEGWTADKGKANGIRFATLKTTSDGEILETTVIPLPAEDPTADEYVLSNLNRWCDQMGLPAKTKADLAADKQPPSSEIQHIKIGSTKVTLVSLIGRLKSGGMSGAPFASGSTRPRPAESNSPPKVVERESGLPKWTVPEGWREAAGNQFSKAAFVVADGDKSVKLTVSTAGGDLLQNVNRWRMQLSLPAWSADEMTKSVKTLPVDGIDSTVVELIGTDARTGKESCTIGAVVPRGGESWFFKLTGDPSLAQREKANFEVFVQSVKFGM